MTKNFKYDITYRNTRTLDEYTIRVDADNHNEALRIAKEYVGPGEEIASIQFVASSVFDGLLNSGLFGRASK